MIDYTFAAGNFGSPMQLLIIAVIVLILFGGSRLRNIGGDLGNAIKGFKKAMNDGDKAKDPEQDKLTADSKKIIEGTVEQNAAEKERVSADKDSSK
jgi:sec-independent protein translocase protein TatA